MNERKPRLKRVMGVDFSGSATAGVAIWIAWGESHGRRLIIRRCLPAAELPGGGRDRPSAHRALVQCLAGSGACSAGLDFPFSLPEEQLGGMTWLEFLQAFPGRFPTADSFRDATRARIGELRRRTDRELQAPFAPNNLRLYHQTYYGLRDVLLPLAAADAVRVLPMQRPRPGVPWLIEACPAVALRRLGIRQPYKGRSLAHRKGRSEILGFLERTAGLDLESRTLRRTVLDQPGGDALDSIVAAWIAWRHASKREFARARDAQERMEGRIYDGFPPEHE